MKKVVLEVGGAFMFLIGFVFMLNEFTGITGYFIMENVTNKSNSMFSLALLIGGMMMFIAGRYVKPSPAIISSNPGKGIRKIKLAKSTRTISYNRLKSLAKEAGYNVVEELDRTTIFSPKNGIIKDENGYPIAIKSSDRNNKMVLLNMLGGIIEDYNNQV